MLVTLKIWTIKIHFQNTFEDVEVFQRKNVKFCILGALFVLCPLTKNLIDTFAEDQKQKLKNIEFTRS